MYDEISCKQAPESHRECGINQAGVGTQTMAGPQSPEITLSDGTRSEELLDAPFFVIVRPPIPGKTAWSVMPW